MSFLERFKGRSNFMTKEGIASVISDSGTPIEKKPKSSTLDSINTPKKKKAAAPLANFTDYNKLYSKNDQSPKATPLSEFMSPIVKDQRFDAPRRPNMNLQIQLNTEAQFYDKEETQFQRANSYFFTPQHKSTGYQEPLSAGHSNFSQRVANLRENSNKPRTGGSRSQIYNKYADDQTQGERVGMDNSPLYNKHQQDYYRQSIFRDAMRHDEGQREDPQEARIARMSFIERQESLISKYKPKIYGEGDSYTQMVLSPLASRGYKLATSKY